MRDGHCGCCAGTEVLTPLPVANRPGLDALSYRVGTHATFLETMVARLSSHRLPDGRRPLQRLTTRLSDDPAIALLDAWATVADVLTFYQERIANEGYLLTATERRSVLELARLVAYRLRPGVAASVYLAFTLEQGYEIDVPAGTRAQSIPEPGELPQVFETEEALPARTAWNAIPARQTRPSLLHSDVTFDGTRAFRVQGAVTNLKVSGVVLFVCPSAEESGPQPVPYTIRAVEADAAADTTLVTYVPFNAGFAEPGPAQPAGITSLAVSTAEGGTETPVPESQSAPLTRLGALVQALSREPSLPPASRFQLPRPLEQTYSAASDLGPRLLAAFTPRLRDTLYAAYASAPVTGVGPEELCRVEALRVRAAPFGHNAPPRLIVTTGQPPEPAQTDWELEELEDVIIEAASNGASTEPFRTMSLDAVHEEITPGSRVVIQRTDPPDDLPNPISARVEQVRTVTRADYGMSATVTQLVLSDPWLSDADRGGDISVLRGTTVYAQSEPLELAEEPIEEHVAGDTIELDGLYDGLEAGRWLVVGGERTDVPGLGGGDGDEAREGIEASELVMLAGVVHDVHRIPTQADGDDGGEDHGAGDGSEEHGASDTREDADEEAPREIELPTDTLHTRLTLSEPLAYTYKRDTVRINANVVRATHGETREEVLGSGNGAQAFQEFKLKQRPLTYVAAPTPKGVESTLEVRVDDVRWPEQETLLYLGAAARGYSTSIDDEGTVSVGFGDGKHGARLPTGVENVTAVYRNGIGKGGNVGPAQISVLASRPLGVKEVVNPQRASGGVDPETRDQARRNVPLAVLALDRLVSVQDYTDFARTFAGIGKASATSLSDGRREIVHLTIAGVDDVPIDVGSDLHRNLMLALTQFGDPNTPLDVALREAVFIALSARVKVHEDYLWTNVEPALRGALLEAFGFDRRELGQDALLSRVIGTMHGVEGVDYVDVDLLDGISETDAADPEALAEKLEALAAASGASPPTARGTATMQPRQRIIVQLARIDPAATDPALRIRPAQVAYLNPELADTLILTEITS